MTACCNESAESAMIWQNEYATLLIMPSIRDGFRPVFFSGIGHSLALGKIFQSMRRHLVINFVYVQFKAAAMISLDFSYYKDSLIVCYRKCQKI